jgi:hypothetical protein
VDRVHGPEAGAKKNNGCQRRAALLEGERIARCLIAVAGDCENAECWFELTYYLLAQERRLRHEDTCQVCIREWAAA